MKRTTKLPNGNTLTAIATLYKIGKQDPYFLLEGEERNPGISRDNGIVRCGCMHEDLVRQWPDLKELELLHLSIIDGVPMHAEANGWYWLAGVMGGLGEKYHGGSGSDGGTPEQCLKIFCDHVRISESEAYALIDQIQQVPSRQYGPDDIGAKRNNRQRRAFFANWIEQQKPRWKREADAAIARFGLEVTI